MKTTKEETTLSKKELRERLLDSISSPKIIKSNIARYNIAELTKEFIEDIEELEAKLKEKDALLKVHAIRENKLFDKLKIAKEDLKKIGAMNKRTISLNGTHHCDLPNIAREALKKIEEE